MWHGWELPGFTVESQRSSATSACPLMQRIVRFCRPVSRDRHSARGHGDQGLFRQAGHPSIPHSCTLAGRLSPALRQKLVGTFWVMLRSVRRMAQETRRRCSPPPQSREQRLQDSVCHINACSKVFRRPGNTVVSKAHKMTKPLPPFFPFFRLLFFFFRLLLFSCGFGVFSCPFQGTKARTCKEELTD